MSRFFSQPSDTRYTLFFVVIGASLAGFSAAFLSLNFLPALSAFPDKELFYAAAALASLLIGPLFWWFFIIKPNRMTMRRGIVVGILGSIAAHPLTWFLAELMAYFMGRHTWMGSVLVNPPLVALLGSPIYSVLSLVYAGWLTMFIGGI